ncbi:hypothetical protein A2U01_0035372, partial [Trifolium medium]|nr:hypothetical protein [Trifolium medium]
EREDGAAAAKNECDAAVAKVREECAGEMEILKKRHLEEKTLLEKEIRLLTLTRNAFIVSCFQVGRDMWDLQGDFEELEEANDGLKQSMADKYVEVFWSSVDQVKALFPDLDQETLAQVDILKKVEDGKFVSRIPGAT